MIPYGLGVGLNVRMGTLLVSAAPTTVPVSSTMQQQQQDYSVRQAKIVAATTLSLSGLVGFTEALILYQCESIVIPLFTSDPAVLETLESIWFAVCTYVVVLHLLAIHDAILRGERRSTKQRERERLCVCVCLPFELTFTIHCFLFIGWQRWECNGEVPWSLL